MSETVTHTVSEPHRPAAERACSPHVVRAELVEAIATDQVLAWERQGLHQRTEADGALFIRCHLH